MRVASPPPSLFMVKLIALSALSGNYGVVQCGQEFEADDDTARELLQRGYVKHAADPQVTYETQALEPSETPEVSPRRPFRHGALRHAKPPKLDTEDAPVVHEPDIPKP